MKIAFTGHRDCLTDAADLSALAAEYPGAVWVHGGAAGFDAQVEMFARQHGIQTLVIRPDYAQLPPKVAPLARNKTIVDGADLVVACYDGRQKGGTAFTIGYARNQGKNIRFLRPAQILHAPSYK